MSSNSFSNRNQSLGALIMALSLLLCLRPGPAAEILTRGDALDADISPIHGRVAMNLEGNIWIIQESGGQALRLVEGDYPLTSPRWSPDGGSILYRSTTPDGGKLWTVVAGTRKTRQLTGPGTHDQDGSWHPDGERIVFASDRHGTGMDLWEMDLPTGLEWRLTDHPGNESQPAWSANGRHLAYILDDGNRHALMLRRLGESDFALIESEEPLAAPSWRPDGSLLTYFRLAGGKPVLEMAILSDPPIIRAIDDGERLHLARVSWRSRMKMLYAADGQLRTRGFEQRRSRPLHFRAVIDSPEPPAPLGIVQRDLEIINAGDTPIIVRGARLFDGIGNRYRENLDIVIEAGRIAAIEERQARDDATVLDLGNTTVIPGLIDVWSPVYDSAASGAAIIAYGVTTILADTGDLGFDPTVWESEALPGPRLLPALTLSQGGLGEPDTSYYLLRVPPGSNAAESRDTVLRWREAGVPALADNPALAASIGVDFLLGASQAPFPSTYLLLSALADAGTPGIEPLLRSRQATRLLQTTLPARRFSEPPALGAVGDEVAVGSRPNGLPPGLSLHAELRALAAAGLTGEQVLHAAGRNGARLLGLENQVGVILPGAAADLVLVTGDPLKNPADLLNIVAVVRNGRFFSLVSLLERFPAPAGVD